LKKQQPVELQEGYVNSRYVRIINVTQV